MDLGEEAALRHALHEATTRLELGGMSERMKRLDEKQQHMLHDANSGCLNILSGIYLLRNDDDDPELTLSEMEKSVTKIQTLIIKMEAEWKGL